MSINQPIIKLCASFKIHRWIQTGVTVRKRPIQVKIGDLFSMWPCNLTDYLKKKPGHLFYATLSFVHHFKAIGRFKLKLQSGNTQFWSKSAVLLSGVTLRFDRWHWKTIGHLFYATSSFGHHFKVIGKSKLNYSPETLGSKSAIVCPVWPWNLTDDLEI